MFKVIALAGLISITSVAQAKGGGAQSRAEFCEQREETNDLKSLIYDPENLMSFANHGGIGNGGVCWWHSRFQRNALMLTSYNPRAERDSDRVIAAKIKKIRAGKEVVILNGHRSFYDFSYTNKDLIQRELERWQKSDGIVKFRWVNGLKGKHVVEAEKLEGIMNDLYRDVTLRGEIVYQKLQIKGITAHAWLVLEVEQTSNGYKLVVLDSNYPNQPMEYYYRYGNTHFYHQYYGDFTPYTDHRADFATAKQTIKEYCKR